MIWQQVKLGDFLKPREDRYKTNDDTVKQLKRIEKIDFGGNIYLSDKPSNTDMIIVKKGDLVISGINVEKGAMSVYQDDEDVTATIHYSSYQYNDKVIDIEFLKYFLKSPEFIDALKKQVPGGIKTEIKAKHIIPLKVSIPINIKDQRLVVNKISKYNGKILTYKQEIENQLNLVSQLRQAFLREAMQGRLVSQDPNDEPASKLLEKIKVEKQKLIDEKKIKKDKPLPPIKAEEIPYEIPSSWIWCRFQDIALIESNLVSPFQHGQLPHIAPNNIEKGTGRLLKYVTVKDDEVKSDNHYFFSGQLLYSKVRPKLNKIVKVNFEGLCSADMYPIKSLIYTDYLKYCMLSKYFIKEVDKFDNRVKMPKINKNQLSHIPIPIAPINEQKRIVGNLDQLMKICDELEESIRSSQQQCRLLMQTVLKEALNTDQKSKLHDKAETVFRVAFKN